MVLAVMALSVKPETALAINLLKNDPHWNEKLAIAMREAIDTVICEAAQASIQQIAKEKEKPEETRTSETQDKVSIKVN